MDGWPARLNNWYSGLAQREQHAVLGGAVVCAALLLFAVWIPIERRVSHLEDSVRTKQADLAWLQSVAPQLGALRNAPAGAGGQSLVVIVDGVARETGIARSVAGSQPGDDGTLSVRLEQVPFDSLVNWAAQLVQHHGVRVVSANIDGGASVGTVSATFVLRPP
jgi:type II secretory pathway component PulM